MEALIIILIDAVRAVVMPVINAVLLLMIISWGSVAMAVFELLAFLVQKWRDTHNARLTTQPAHVPVPAEPASAPASAPRRRRWLRWLLIGGACMTTTVLSAMVLINLWFIDDLARWQLVKLRERNGIAITAETIEGNLFTGRFQASGVSVKRTDHPAGLIELSARRVEADVSVWRVFRTPLEVRSLSVDGVHGRFERGVPGQAPVKKKKQQEAKEPKQKRPFVITSLAITNLDVAYADHTRKRPLALPVVIQHLTAEPLRSQWAVFDVLFRANATGTIAGRPFHLSTSGDDLGRETKWHVNGLPVEILAQQIGGPFTLLTGGTCDVDVTDRWRMSGDDRVIVMDWSVVLKEVQAEVPEDTSPLMALLAKPAVAFINAKAERVPLSFRVELDEERFDGAASAEAAGLWEVVADSAAATFAKMLGLDTDSVKGTSEQLLDKAKDALDKWRKKKD